MSTSSTVTLSWAEVLLILLLAIGCFGAWSVVHRYVGSDEVAPIAAREEPQVLRVQREIELLEQAWLAAKLQLIRAEITRVESSMCKDPPLCKRALAPWPTRG
jgi:hypothetical protein